MTDDLLLETRGAVGVVTLNRPKALNALNLGMCRALHPALDAWAADPAIQAVVIRGAGGRAFCAGGDVRAVALSVGDAPRGEKERVSREFFRAEYGLNHRIHYFGKPFVALSFSICRSVRILTGRVGIGDSEEMTREGGEREALGGRL